MEKRFHNHLNNNHLNNRKMKLFYRFLYLKRQSDNISTCLSSKANILCDTRYISIFFMSIKFIFTPVMLDASPNL